MATTVTTKLTQASGGADWYQGDQDDSKSLPRSLFAFLKACYKPKLMFKSPFITNLPLTRCNMMAAKRRTSWLNTINFMSSHHNKHFKLYDHLISPQSMLLISSRDVSRICAVNVRSVYRMWTVNYVLINYIKVIEYWTNIIVLIIMKQWMWANTQNCIKEPGGVTA